ncbi:HEAT repeat domain-containing protein [Hymenobacter sp. BT770]|uniref:HEAT repeat domain-containing protein n=1 Tax=Hymenobacter sp. BT770 TaxID=2886942 RepID=UPI001D0FB861|nr:HEAT repeat domain-containing protein [Hymenobacter sp. BT770]MCC3151628.1 HEAT repeat domain-containing protein [Hymenobacter sp. BT770]MDO3413795.1 HEAT repeat domain-containing protein [Hymenobacter sp. BT770]
MNCERTKEQLVDYLSSQLNPTEQQELAAHLAECADCREELQAVQRVWQTMGNVPVPEPSPHVRADFYAMLSAFKQQEEAASSYSLKGLWQRWLALEIPVPLLRLVYSACLIGVGLIGGYWLNNEHKPERAEQQQIAALAGQVGDMRQMMLLALIENPSATERLRAVSYTKQLDDPNARVVNALLSTLNNDPNVNVRLATLEALAPLAQDPTVRLGLVHALANQDSPLVQTALADVMVQLQERRSVKPLRELLKQENLDQTVKSKIEQTIQTLSHGRPAAPSTPLSHDQPQHSPQPERPAFAAV